MNATSKMAVVVLLCVVTGCRHKTPATPPSAAQAPIYPASTVAQGPPPQLPPAKPLDVKPPASDVAQQEPPEKPRKQSHHKQKPADSAQTQAAKDQAASATTQQASAGEPPEMSPIGQLSSAGGSNNLLHRQDIQDQITATEKGLNGIKRTLSPDEQVTATQIRTFLTKAAQALSQDDLDGAYTLVTKAKVLLAELTKS